MCVVSRQKQIVLITITDAVYT